MANHFKNGYNVCFFRFLDEGKIEKDAVKIKYNIYHVYKGIITPGGHFLALALSEQSREEKFE